MLPKSFGSFNSPSSIGVVQPLFPLGLVEIERSGDNFVLFRIFSMTEPSYRCTDVVSFGLGISGVSEMMSPLFQVTPPSSL
ncbi:hypothetical protein D3C71_1947730 [compost metagenome]